MSFADEKHLRSLTDAPAPTPKPAPSLLRLFRFPLIVLAMVASIILIPVAVCKAFDLNADAYMQFFMVTIWMLPPLTILILTFWWIVFFRGIAFFARLGVLILVLGLIGMAGASFSFFAVRNVEFGMTRVGLFPRIHFVWDYSAEEEATQKIAADSAKADDLPAIDATVGLEDFPAYRGRKTDGIVAFAKLNSEWQQNAPKVLWRQPCPGGSRGVAVAGNIVVTMQQRTKEGQEVVVCYDRATGKHRWTHAYNAFHRDVMGNGPRSTPTIHNNHIYTIGATGQLVCLTVEGKLKWTRNILADGNAKNIKWGMTGSPLIVDDLVIANPGVDPDNLVGPSLIAYDQATGKIRWQTGKRKAGYSSPQLVVFGNVPQILIFDGDGLVGYDITGKELWQHPWITDFEMNSIQPVVLGNDQIFISSELKNGCAMVRVQASKSASNTIWTAETVWENKNLAARYANPVTDGKSIFGLHNMSGVLTCLDVKTGKVKWKDERFGPGQLLLADDLLLVVNGETGDAVLFDLDGNEKGRFTALEKKDKTWNTPALAGDQLFIRNQAEIVCVKLPRR